jgi:hypothetical protein
VQYLLKTVLSLLITMLMFEGMVFAFHLLNLPSNLAVLGGVCLLLITAAGGLIAFRFVWKKHYVDVR